MRNYLIIFTLLFFIIFQNFGNAQQLSPRAEISLLTCSPGDVLYLAFGHSAVRVNDPLNGIDYVYNYGTFDFDTPNFYPKFVRGKLNYMLSRGGFHRFLAVYRYENRSIREQIFNLTAEGKQKIFKLLEINYKQENRFYQYDFYFDNCATRIRDILQKALGKNLKFNSDSTNNLSFRELTDLYLEKQRWGDFGIDIGLGAVVDRKANYLEQMFLPDYLEKGFANAEIKRNGEWQSIIKQQHTLNKTEANVQDIFWLYRPLILFSVIAFFVIVFSILWYRKKYRSWFDIFLFTVFGFVGIVVLLLWTATEHNGTAQNYNILWAFPLHLIAAIMLIRPKGKILEWYFKIFSVTNILVLLLWTVIPQSYNLSFIPIIIMLTTRSFIITKKIRSEK